ncbi:glycogen synthase [Streptomyces kunmingensis]|uniref:D-inositol 3-phosphate glycosyltransferase n=1 Tax=Streptomyces kunmingensis TaxID=68225 RepID=A0ABU6CL37_9ACTN|nr:glycogen synthase [Streptomyces kunmingensis]MEB3964696.1 glycogen synthase [Streptomyces kunmingensis]
MDSAADRGTRSRTDLLTREYPPEIYGGAGVHVTELTRSLRRLTDVRVRCLGEPRQEKNVTAYLPDPALADVDAALGFLGADLAMARDCAGAGVVHSHTWYANMAGHLARELHGAAHVMTMHSLEPLRPWKAEQLGGGYALSSWMERTAIASADRIVAVSAAMREDVLRVYPQVAPERVRVIHNGIDPDVYRPDPEAEALRRFGIDPDRPYVLFVGRVTRQKGLPHLLRAAFALPPGAQLVLCCGQPDTPEIAAEVAALVEELRTVREGVFRIDGMLDTPTVRQLLTHAAVFVCPSVYEPMGIVNLEAMACARPVVASAVGGIPEVVADGLTGTLVPFEAGGDASGEPADPERFARDLAAAIGELLDAPERAAKMGAAGRERAVSDFSWDRAAERTMEVYEAAMSLR